MIEFKKAQVRLEDCIYIICIVIDQPGQGYQWRGGREARSGDRIFRQLSRSCDRHRIKHRTMSDSLI